MSAVSERCPPARREERPRTAGVTGKVEVEKAGLGIVGPVGIPWFRERGDPQMVGRLQARGGGMQATPGSVEHDHSVAGSVVALAEREQRGGSAFQQRLKGSGTSCGRLLQPRGQSPAATILSCSRPGAMAQAWAMAGSVP